MPIFYQERDAGFIDYKPYLICDKPKFFVRGPELDPGDLEKGNYFSVVGNAETVGAHAERPYGTILSQRLGTPCLNLAKGGVCITFYNQPEKQKVIDYINKGKFLILTFMSGRQISTSLFETRKGSSHCVYNNEKMEVEHAWRLILEEYWDREDFLENLAAEVRRSYVTEYLRFLEKIRVPVILFYFSQREPKYSFNREMKSIYSLWSNFPQLVDDTTVEKILKESNAVYAKCVSARGIPYTLKDSTGKEKPLWHPLKKEFQLYHRLYPSPEMHEDGADVLEPLCRNMKRGDTNG